MIKDAWRMSCYGLFCKYSNDSVRQRMKHRRAGSHKTETKTEEPGDNNGICKHKKTHLCRTLSLREDSALAVWTEHAYFAAVH